MTTDQPLVERRAYPSQVLSDCHDFHQLLLGLSGNVELEADGRGTRVTAGVLVPITAGERHHYLALRDNDCLTLDLPVAWCEALGLDVRMNPVPRRLSPTLLASAPKLTVATSAALLSWLNEALEGPGSRVTTPRLQLIRLLSAIESDLAHPWRVNEMAAYCHLAEAAFARQFRSLTGQSPHSWLIARRHEQARCLMRDPGASLTEIAVACGFANAAHFSRSFRGWHGCSPREWRSTAHLKK